MTISNKVNKILQHGLTTISPRVKKWRWSISVTRGGPRCSAVSVVLAEDFFSLEHGTTLETRGFSEVSRRGGRPLLRLEPFPTAGYLEPAGGNGLD